MRRSSSFPLAALTFISSLTLVACQAKSPEEQVAEKRAKYSVELNSWYAQVENEVESEDAVSAAGEAMADEAAEDGEDTMSDETVGEEMLTGPQPHTIVLDLLVLYDGRGEPLPGITVKVTHADADGNEKSSWLDFLAVPEISKGTSKQVGSEKQGVLFEEGDVFAVTLIKNVPADERSKYREFSTAGSQP